MKCPIAFTISTLIILSFAGLVFYFFGLPMLADTSVKCHYGANTEILSCSSSFGSFIKMLSTAVALALAGVWSLFGR
ncbi:MAG: hypothetical protein JO278_06985 [Dyella sp.]|nr:hypothetical protein [Dyella sp.]